MRRSSRNKTQTQTIESNPVFKTTKDFEDDESRDVDEQEDEVKELMANDQRYEQANDNNTNHDQNGISELNDQSCSVRRSTRVLSKKRKFYQAESLSSSSSSSESDHHESSENDDKSAEYELSDVDASEEEQILDNRNKCSDSSSAYASTSSVKSPRKLYSAQVVSNCANDIHADHDNANSSDDETEIEEEETVEGQKQNRKELRFEVLSLKCSECSADFEDKPALNDHLLTVHQIRQFRCYVRGCELVSFELHKQLTQQHNKTKHDKQSEWPCALCSTTLSSYTYLSKHSLDYHQEGAFKCKLCDFESTHTTRVKIKLHLRSAHPAIVHRCTVKDCDKVFKTSSHLVRHAVSHTNEKAFKCTKCEKCFKNKECLASHSRNVHQRIRPYKCVYGLECQYEASSSSAVEMHIMRVHFVAGDKRKAKDFIAKQPEAIDNRKRKKNVNSCKPEPIKRKKAVETTNQDKLIRNKTNTIVVWLNCPIDGCVEHRPNLVQLNAHILESHQIEQYRCLVRDCGQSFKYCAQFGLHKEQHEKSGTALACPKCDYVCTTAKYSNLFYHFYQNHEEGRYACNYPECNFVTDTCRRAFNSHWAIHRPLKYKCTVDGCSEAFKENKLLRNHVKSHQSEVNRFSGCPHCGRTDFVRSNSFRDHVKSHARKDGGYRCVWKVKNNEPCGWFSTISNSVHDHIRAQHLSSNKSDAGKYKDLNIYMNKVFPNKTPVKKLRKSSKAARNNKSRDKTESD